MKVNTMIFQNHKRTIKGIIRKILNWKIYIRERKINERKIISPIISAQYVIAAFINIVPNDQKCNIIFFDFRAASSSNIFSWQNMFLKHTMNIFQKCNMVTSSL